MVNDILNFISFNFSKTTWIAVFIVAMLPIAEAKVAIPFGMAKGVWGSAALSPIMSAVVSFIGSTLPAIFIILFLKPVFEMLKKTKSFKKLIINLENLFRKRSEREISVEYIKEQREVRNRERELRKILKTQSQHNGDKLLRKKEALTKILNETKAIENKKKETTKLKQIITLMFFVALPLPLAGVWMSSAIAAVTDMKFWPSLAAIAFGNLMEVVFITIICVLFNDSIGYVLIGSLILIIAYIVSMHIISRRREKIIESATAKIVSLNNTTNK